MSNSLILCQPTCKPFFLLGYRLSCHDILYQQTRDNSRTNAFDPKVKFAIAFENEAPTSSVLPKKVDRKSHFLTVGNPTVGNPIENCIDGSVTARLQLVLYRVSYSKEKRISGHFFGRSEEVGASISKAVATLTFGSKAFDQEFHLVCWYQKSWRERR